MWPAPSVPRLPSTLAATVLLCAAVLLDGCTSTASDAETVSEELEQLVSSYEARLADGLETGLPVRDDGFAYAVDLGNTMGAAVALGNRSLFDRAYGMIRAHFLRVDTGDPRARHTVLWRYKPGTAPDASGSRETGLLADALWEAYERWGNPEHRRMATKVLDAYLRHGYWETDRRFVVKNYYNYGTQTLSENTWVLNQMPHTVRKIACGTQDASLFRRANAMARFAEGAYLKKGFSREMYDKGIETVFDGADGYYSPNGLLKLQSSLEIAKALLPFTSAPAREIIGFIRASYPDVSSAYYYNPRSKAIAPLAETSEQAYGLSEKALVLLLATRVRDSLGEAFLQDFVGREIVPELKRRRDESSSPFYFDVPLMLEAAQRYLRPDQVPAPPGESECTP
ncbi:hypothetical protein [Salinibacter ruber]|uniref:hypothetical protein n=1 Tax=Salinibacter ruber TaxID=146919 RepID=UPI002169B6F0|nr:hypothetical protein [Salinibacter ruber]MCS3756193.1 hypothetical protein [Salinibacter ruber]MCS3956456.1 hypothetical protein [Salinibacter ruber]MCS4040955.1 hypothetical protein [Salinibacter ruber]